MEKKNYIFNNYKLFIKKKVNFLYALFLIYLLFYIRTNFSPILNEDKMKVFYEKLPYINKNNIKPKSITEIFESNILYINDANITKDYISYIRSEEEKEQNNNNTYMWKNMEFDENIFPKRKDQLNYIDFGKLCLEEKLINKDKKFEVSIKPLISIIVVAFNKENIIFKSIRSIQNQSLKNIEIIIVDDSSTDQSFKIYDYLLQSDPRIRIFHHIKNLGCWRSRINGFLYSKGKYVIHFDAGDLYEDNYVLEDFYNIIEKYNIDTVKMICRFIYDFQNLTNSKLAIKIKDKYTKIAFQPEIERYNHKYFKNNGWIWTTLVKRNIYTKCLMLLNTRILNFYKNYHEDYWWKRLVNYVAESFLILKRYSYLYFKNGEGEGDFKVQTDEQKSKMILEHLEFLYFELEFLPKTDNKSLIIKKLRKFNNNKRVINFGFLKSKLYLLDDLINELIKDRYVAKNDKIFLKHLLNQSKLKQLNYLKNQK